MDDELFLGQQDENISQSANQKSQIINKKSLKDIIVPMKVKDLYDEYFLEILNKNENQIKLNIFIIGYQCDQGVRACGGRSGSELGPDIFRELLHCQDSNQHQLALIQIAQDLKDNQVNIYDLGNITKYQLSKYCNRQKQTKSNESFSQLFKYISEKIKNAKIFVVGGSDDVCKSVYESHLYDNILHLDSQIDVKPQFKIQIEDRDKQGNLLFEPTYNESHKSYLRQIFSGEQSNLQKQEGDLLFQNLKSLTFYGIQGQYVSQEDVDLINNQKRNIEKINLVFFVKDIQEQQKSLVNILENKKEVNEKSATCIDLTCMRAEFAPGVSDPNSIIGFTSDQMKENLNIIAKYGHDDLILVSEFNPAIEKLKTGNFIIEMFITLLNSWVQNLK